MKSFAIEKTVEFLSDSNILHSRRVNDSFFRCHHVRSILLYKEGMEKCLSSNDFRLLRHFSLFIYEHSNLSNTRTRLITYALPNFYSHSMSRLQLRILRRIFAFLHKRLQRYWRFKIKSLLIRKQFIQFTLIDCQRLTSFYLIAKNHF